jgi:salicylate hydroxylase
MKHAGFDVIVFEKVRKFDRLGDSLGLGENALKLLERWAPGIPAKFLEIGNKSQYMQVRRWKDGKLLAQQPLMDMAGPIGHRGDYHDVFLQAVEDAGVPLHMGHEVIAYDDIRPAVTLRNGDVYAADIIIAADG